MNVTNKPQRTSVGRLNESQLKKLKINNGSEIENAWAFNMYIATRVNLNTDSKTLYYSIRELKYSPSILKHSQG